jgi:hypothetical protein
VDKPVDNPRPTALQAAPGLAAGHFACRQSGALPVNEINKLAYRDLECCPVAGQQGDSARAVCITRNPALSSCRNLTVK